jgi:hypothetical protein
MNTAFGGSDKIAGLESFFRGFGGSIYAKASTEYYQNPGAVHVGSASTFGGHLYDNSAAPSAAPTTTQAAAEVCKVTNDQPDEGGVYFLYTSTGAGNVSYCAWHSFGTCSNGKKVQVAYMPNIDGIAGCNPNDTYDAKRSEGLSALVNVTAHELSETLTDPRNGGWWDKSGDENGDKCAWAFNTGPVVLSYKVPDGLGGFTTVTKNWKLQGEWSNAAYSAGTGYPNLKGAKGCLPN